MRVFRNKILCLWLMLALLFTAGCSANPGNVEPEGTYQLNQAGLFSADKSYSTVDIVKLVSPSVVGLAVKLQKTDASGLRKSIEGIGTGIIVDSSGYILTNHHVAGAADEITVVFRDGTRAPAQKVWSDSSLDLAVIKMDGKGYPAARLGSVEDVEVGEPAIAIGTPLDMAYQHTVTVGVVSAKGRTLEVPTDDGVSFMEELIQTDASINPGNSGGPLCSDDGTVIGINTVKVSDAEGMGFAIPIDICKPIVDTILRTGSYTTPYLGLYAIDPQIARYYGVEDPSGVCVIQVDGNGPAAGAVQSGDFIVSVNGEEIKTVMSLRRKLYALGVGGEITLALQRGNETLSAVCTLTEKPAE